MPIIRQGKVQKEHLPSPIQRSDAKAKRTFAEAHDSALKEYHQEARADRVAYAALKRTHEKIGDHWEPKSKRGPSDKRAALGRRSPAKTAGGVNALASKEHLYQVASRLDIPQRSQMNKKELVSAIKRANNRQTAKKRRSFRR